VPSIVQVLGAANPEAQVPEHDTLVLDEMVQVSPDWGCPLPPQVALELKSPLCTEL
jgi:hypothetical protein